MLMYDTDNIAIQMRKGILEYLILLIISKGEVYASDIISGLQKYDLLIVEGTLYPLLSRLKKDQLLTYSWVESASGPPRIINWLLSANRLWKRWDKSEISSIPPFSESKI